MSTGGPLWRESRQNGADPRAHTANTCTKIGQLDLAQYSRAFHCQFTVAEVMGSISNMPMTGDDTIEHDYTCLVNK